MRLLKPHEIENRRRNLAKKIAWERERGPLGNWTLWRYRHDRKLVRHMVMTQLLVCLSGRLP